MTHIIERTIPSKVIREMQLQQSPEAFITFLTLSHPDISEPIRVAADAVDYIKGGNYYYGFTFQIVLVTDSEDLPRAQLQLQNVSRVIPKAVRSMIDPMTVDIEVVAASEYDLIRPPQAPRPNPRIVDSQVQLRLAAAADGAFFVVGPGTCWQDTARTIPARSIGDPVRGLSDISGFGRHATFAGTNPPTLDRVDATKHWYLQFDGTARYDFSLGSAPTNFTLLTAVSFDSVGSSTVEVPLSCKVDGVNGAGADLRKDASDEWSAVIEPNPPGTDVVAATGFAVSASTPTIGAGFYDGSDIYVSGDNANQASAAGATYSSNANFSIGARNDGSNPFTGRFFGAVVTPAFESAGDRTEMISQLAELCNLQTLVTDPITYIYQARRLNLIDVDVSTEALSGQLVSWNYRSEPYPGMSASKSRFPGLFR